MSAVSPTSAAELAEVNRDFYEGLWSQARLVAPERFNTWPLVAALAAKSFRRLEVAPGLRPRLPLSGSHFIDISPSAVSRLHGCGAYAARAQIGALPFPGASFDLVCAFDIIEHVDDDDAALAELARVATPGATVLLSVPLHAAQWTAFDEFVGHRRRYEPPVLLARLAAHGFALEQSAIYGMQPKSTRLLDHGIWYLIHQRERAMWWYNHVFMPLGMRLQKPLALTAGMIETAGVDEVLLVCRRQAYVSVAEVSTRQLGEEVPQ